MRLLEAVQGLQVQEQLQLVLGWLPPELASHLAPLQRAELERQKYKETYLF